MLVFRYDKTFEGVLSAVFDAYAGKAFPERLIGEREPAPMFTEAVQWVVTAPEKAERVWQGLHKRMPRKACNMLFHAFLSEEAGCDETLFRYICKVFRQQTAIYTNFTDPDILKIQQIALKVSREAEHVRQFVRFRRAGDGTYFAPIAPKYNALPLSLSYFRDRFADQKWIVYDTRRKYGFYYDRKTVVEINLPNDPLVNGELDEKLMADDEKEFQTLWRNYFNALTIPQRFNPKAQRQHLPRRFWEHLPEMR
jgi:probable DNA metabolism protein